METLSRWVRRTLGGLTTKLAGSSAANFGVRGQSAAAAVPKSPENPSGPPSVMTSSTPDTEAGHEPPVYKVVTVGGCAVGKSSLIIQFMYDEVRRIDQP